LFRVKNNALSAAGLRQGDVLVVERDAVPREGNIVVSLVGEDLCLRRIDLGPKGYITASQNDPECAYLAREGHEVVRVWGLVKHCVRAIT
jgi:DNA polymerase V